MNWLCFVLALLGLAVLAIPGLGWWNNPELQLFHEYWMYFVIAIICFLIAKLILLLT